MPYLQSAALTQPPRRSSPSGSKNHRATLYCRQADSAAAAFCVSARLALVFQRGHLLCSGVIYNLPERRAPQLRWIIQRNGVAVAVLARGEPSAELPAARVRRTVADSASSCCGLQISVNLQSCPVRPSIAFSGVRLIRAHVVTGCPVGLEIHWYRMQPFCCGGWPPAGTAGANLGPLEPAPGSGMASAPSRRDC